MYVYIYIICALNSLKITPTVLTLPPLLDTYNHQILGWYHSYRFEPRASCLANPHAGRAQTPICTCQH